MARDGIATTTFQVLLQQHEEVCVWLEGIGVPVAPGRIASYTALLHKLVECYEAERWDEINDELAGHLNALYESSDLYRIFRTYSAQKTDGLASKLKDVVHGADSYLSENESSSNKARNTAFELLVGCRFVDAGYTVSFPANGDVRVELPDYSLHVECKRLTSKRKVEKNVKKAQAQFSKHFVGPKKSMQFGLVALDITKLANPDFNLLVAENKESLDAMLSTVSRTMIAQHLDGKPFAAKSRQVGILVRYSGMAVAREANIYTYCQWFTMFTAARDTTKEGVVARDVAAAMEKVPEGAI